MSGKIIELVPPVSDVRKPGRKAQIIEFPRCDCGAFGTSVPHDRNCDLTLAHRRARYKAQFPTIE